MHRLMFASLLENQFPVASYNTYYFLIVRPMTNSAKTQWQHLEQRSDSWRKQLYIKGRKLRVRNVWSDMIVNQWSIEKTADNWDLSVEAVKEVIEYCQANQELLAQEADEERRYLEQHGVKVEPQITH